MIDLLSSSGMRVGEMVTLNREDINFNERECVVIGKGNKELICLYAKFMLMISYLGLLTNLLVRNLVGS